MNEQQWTNEQLISEAGCRGYKLDERKVSYYTETGLLDKAERKSAGRGSHPGVRSDEQAELLWVVLQHARTVRRTATLVNIPVFVWLGWGDRYVPVRQVRRCLRTYADAYNTASQAACRRTTGELIDSLGLASVPARARNRLADVITQLNAAPRPNLNAHRDDFRQALRSVIESTGSTVDMSRLDAMVDFIDLRIRALHHFHTGQDDSELPDAAFYRAQLDWQQTRFDYVRESQLPISTINEDMANNACLSLLAHLGHDIRTTERRNR